VLDLKKLPFDSHAKYINIEIRTKYERKKFVSRVEFTGWKAIDRGHKSLLIVEKKNVFENRSVKIHDRLPDNKSFPVTFSF